jgi:hypothetical protein
MENVVDFSFLNLLAEGLLANGIAKLDLMQPSPRHGLAMSFHPRPRGH